MGVRIPSNKIPKGKISISFTWDDNSSHHASSIAPLFFANGFRCTFYIVPGNPDFDSLYASAYAELGRKGFEIGSHSYSHKHMTLLSKQEVEFELKESINKIITCIKQYPLTFAFPNHDYNEFLINIARSYHLETRNTLVNSTRFSIKTDTSLESLIQAVKDSILNKRNLVFSGHSIITEEELFKKESGEGYQPMRLLLLSDLLAYLKTVASEADVIPFSKSALREFVKGTATFDNQEWIMSSEVLKPLRKFTITEGNLISLL